MRLNSQAIAATTTVAETIKWAIARGLRRVNLSTGTDVSKTRWSPEAVRYRSGVLVSPTALGRLRWELASRCQRAARGDSALARLIRATRRSG
jgi:CelD/BcsL family acetyltransferase involved in cellulose biosynthesis